MSDDDSDVLIWSEHQAELLRRLAAGEPMDGSPDWRRLAEEIEDLRRSELRSVESLPIQALLHSMNGSDLLMKVQAWPGSLSVLSRRAEARLHSRRTRRRSLPSTGERIGLAELPADARAGLPEAIVGQPFLPLPEAFPLGLGALLAYGDGPAQGATGA